MSDFALAESRSVPRLLSLLASSVERVAEEGARNTAGFSWGDVTAQHDGNGSDPAATGFSPSSLRIRDLRRAYNIILFGGASHAEIVSQAALEDEVSDGDGSTFGGASSSAAESYGGMGYDTLASVSAVSLELRRTRRYDPANALEGLVEELLASTGDTRQEQAVVGASFVVRVLRLLLAMRGEGGQARGADDWELLGQHGRRVLEELYSSTSSTSSTSTSSCYGRRDLGCQEQQQQRQQRRHHPTTASTPVAMFFRGGQGGSMQARSRAPKRLAAASDCREGPCIPGAELASAAKEAPSAVLQHQRYLLPHDCVLHGDSTATATVMSSTPSSSSGIGAMQHIPWFTGAAFASERGIPNINNGLSSDALHCTAPPSPAAWTRVCSNADAAGGRTSSSSSAGPSYGSGGAPAAPAAAAAHEGSGGSRLKPAKMVTAAQAAGQRARDRAPSGCGPLDLCGALSQARVDPQSIAVKELRLALSFPDLVEGHPPDLVKAARLQQVQGRPTNSPADGTVCCRRVEGEHCTCSLCGRGPRSLCSPGSVARSAMQQSLQRSPRSATVSCTVISEPPRGVDTVGNSGGIPHGVSTHKSPETRLRPVGWERTESKWDDSSFPTWALCCAPLVTGEGGGDDSKRAFEVCYREHFGLGGVGGFSGQEGAPVATEAEVVLKALAVVQGVPSGYFWYDENYARMRVSGHRGDEQARPDGDRGARGKGTAWLPSRVAGLSPAALSSLLKEFARAGTWYRRVEEFAAYLVDRCSAAGQVAHAFGVELRRQLTAVQSALLGVTAEVAGAKWTDPESPASAKRSSSLTAVLLRTARLRRAAGALAEICGLFEDDMGTLTGVRAVFDAFPRGASLLTYLYNAAEIRMASKPGVGGEGGSAGAVDVVMGDKDSALALLSSAAAPYLSMLARWLWSGEMRAEDDPHEEFPLRHREVPLGITGPPNTGRNGGAKEAKAPWMENGGGSFMTIAFSENEAACVPCFLEGGVLAAAAQAGKLLRMLKLSSPEFYAACSASPPPPLSLVYGSRALASRVAVFERLRLLRVTAGRSAAREVRARAAEDEMRKGMGSGIGSEQLLAGEESALGKLEQQRQRDQASVEEARRIWVRGLETDRASAGVGAPNATSSEASVAAANATAAAAAATEEPLAAAASGGQGVLSFLNPPTSKAEAFAAAAITERYRLLGEEADARAARARWKRRRSARMVAARTSLKMLYAEERHLWQTIAAEAAAVSAVSKGVARNEAAVVHPAADGVVESVEASSVTASSGVSDSDGGGGGGGGGCDGGGGEADRGSGEAVAEEEVSIDDGERVNVCVGSEVEETADVTVRPRDMIPDVIDKDDTEKFSSSTNVNKQVGESAGVSEAESMGDTIARGGHAIPRTRIELAEGVEVKFSPVTIVDEPGGKSVGVSAALSSFGDQAQEVKFSHVQVLQEPGGKSCGVSEALRTDIDRMPSGTALTTDPLPGRSGVRRIVQEPGGNSKAVASILSHGSDGKANRASRVGGITTVEESGERGDRSEALPRPFLQESKPGDVPVGFSLPADGVAVARDDTGSRSRSEGSPYSGNSPHCTGSARAGGSGVGAAACDKRASAKRSSGRSHLQKSEEKRKGAGGRAADSDSFLPLEMTLRRCVRDQVLAQCSAVDSAALAFLVRDAGVAEHLASLRTFLLGLTSDFLHDFTLRLLDGLYDDGMDWRRPANLDAAFAASASATGLDSVPFAAMFRYEVDPTCAGVLGTGSTRISAGTRHRPESSGMGAVRAQSTAIDATSPRAVRSSSSRSSSPEELYSPTALSFVSPVLEVKWPVGVLLQTGVLHTYGRIHRSLFQHQLALHRLRRLRVALRELDACVDASRGGGGGGSGARGRRSALGGGVEGGTRRQPGAGVSWDRGRIHWLHLFRHEMQHMADSLQNYFAEPAEAGWPDLHRSLSAAREGGRREGGGGLAALVAAHSRYISRMHSLMFLGTDRQGAVARARIGEFYGVVCTVSRITDGLLSSESPVSSPSAPFSSAADGSLSTQPRNSSEQRDGGGRMSTWQQQEGGCTEEMILPDGAFAQLAAVREKFDAARRGLCDALTEICDAGGGARARPLLAIIGYGGYGGDDL